MKCCICGTKILEHGNNPWPVKKSGKCCDTCNMTIVLEKRIEILMKERRIINDTERQNDNRC